MKHDTKHEALQEAITQNLIGLFESHKDRDCYSFQSLEELNNLIHDAAYNAAASIAQR